MSQESKKKWYAVDVQADPEAAEAVESAFNILDSAGTEINNLRKQADEPVIIIGYFNILPSEQHLKEAIDESLRIYSLDGQNIKSLQTRDVEDSDWLAEWKKHWRPTEAGKFIIAPPWSEIPENDKIVIRIEPNMAFGTGTHETTRLCLEAISRCYVPEQTFLDVGTGTGILAIAAAKLSDTSELIAFETDADSVDIARQNAVINGVGDRIAFWHSSIDETTRVCDFVCANLTLSVITPLLPLLLHKARQTLVLSGILVEQTDEISRELVKLGVSKWLIYTAGEWISVIISQA